MTGDARRQAVYREMDAKLDTLMMARRRDLIGLAPARMALGTADWRERWAWRMPRLLGWLERGAATERLTGRHPRDVERERLAQLRAQLDRDRRPPLA